MRFSEGAVGVFGVDFLQGFGLGGDFNDVRVVQFD